MIQQLIKTLVDEEFSSKTQSQEVENLKSSTEYLRIVIELYTKDRKYAEYSYSNGATKGWIDEDWMNYDFINKKSWSQFKFVADFFAYYRL